jgi:hypothetical protein
MRLGDQNERLTPDKGCVAVPVPFSVEENKIVVRSQAITDGTKAFTNAVLPKSLPSGGKSLRGEEGSPGGGAFAAGVREAQEQPAALSAEAKEAQTRLQDAENSLDRDNSRVAQLTSALAKATGARADSLDNQLQQAKVQVDLDQDEVDNAKQELILAGGDAQGRIEELMKEHEAASRIADSTTVNTATPPDAHGLVHHYLQWSQLHSKTLELRQARQDAESAAVAFTTKRENRTSKRRNKNLREQSAADLRLPRVQVPRPLPATPRLNSSELRNAAWPW